MQEEKTVAKYLLYFDELVHENEEDIITICESASKKIYDQIGMKFEKKVDDAKAAGVIFSVIYDVIIEKLKDLETIKSAAKINFCNRIEIGFTTSDDEEDEKQGNFMIYINDLGNVHTDIKHEDPKNTPSIDKAAYWNVMNNIEASEIIKDIAGKSVDILQNKYGITIASWEFIPGFFSILYEAIVNYVKIRRSEKDDYDYEVYFMSCFSIKAQISENGEDLISITPNINSKLALKDDIKATSTRD